MRSFIQLYLIALPIFLVIDGIWLSVVAKGFYSKHIGSLMKTDINFLAAAIFYLLFIVGLVVFVISPSLENKSFISTIALGALFGLLTYATYDLTNLATLKNWSIIVTIVDMVWGAFLAASVSALSYLAATKLGL
jgi:uncharacterized membrane protein